MVPQENTIIFALVYILKEYTIFTPSNTYHGLMILSADYLSLTYFEFYRIMVSCDTYMFKIKDKCISQVR